MKFTPNMVVLVSVLGKLFGIDSSPDKAMLYNAQGQEVSRKSY
jgi:hypothetical protein